MFNAHESEKQDVISPQNVLWGSHNHKPGTNRLCMHMHVCLCNMILKSYKFAKG